MKTLILNTQSREETHALGEKLGAAAKENMVFLLSFNLFISIRKRQIIRTFKTL